MFKRARLDAAASAALCVQRKQQTSDSKKKE
jgi:hypothetical protein